MSLGGHIRFTSQKRTKDEIQSNLAAKWTFLVLYHLSNILHQSA